MIATLLLAVASTIHAPAPAREAVVEPSTLAVFSPQPAVDGSGRLIPNVFPSALELAKSSSSPIQWPEGGTHDLTFVTPRASTDGGATDAFPVIDVKFDAVFDGGVAPPDAVLAVGKNSLVVLINLQVAMYDKAGVLKSGPFSLSSFFGFPPGFGGGFDPLAVYDPFSDRFVITALADNGGANDSRIFVAFSQTGNAAGAWNKYSIDADAGQTGTWIDYASIGIDRNAVYFTGNMFQRSGGYSNATLFIYDKEDGYAGRPLDNTHIINVRTASGATTYRLRPAYVGEVVPGDEFYLAYTDSSFGDRLSLWRLTGNRFASPTLTASDVALPGTYFPIGNARQPGSGGGVATLGTNVWNAYYKNGALWVSQAVNGSAGIAAWIHRVRMSSTPAVREQTYQVEESGKDIYFPYVIPDTEDNDFAVFSAYSSTSIFATGRYINVSAAGATRYAETVVAATLRNDSGRHGDYFAVGQDPLDPNRLWSINGYMKNSTFAGTNRVSSVRFEDVPAPSNPAPVPDGKSVLGQQVRATKASAGQLTVTYDNTACNTPGHHIVWFDLATVSSYTPTQVTCAIGNSGTWTGAPATGNVGYLVVSDDLSTTEGSHGPNSNGQERPSQSNACGITQKSITGTCGP
ncbi:MAG: hypothetical protein U0V87_03690 [Acidobacteriota bacterium]